MYENVLLYCNNIKYLVLSWVEKLHCICLKKWVTMKTNRELWEILNITLDSSEDIIIIKEEWIFGSDVPPPSFQERETCHITANVVKTLKLYFVSQNRRDGILGGYSGSLPMRSSILEGRVFWTEVSMSSMRSSNLWGGGGLLWTKVSKSFMRSFIGRGDILCSQEYPILCDFDKKFLTRGQALHLSLTH